MKERPILFSGPMVRAILDGRKTQTRRIVKPQPSFVGDEHNSALGHTQESLDGKCPYGRPGDRLWVKETFKPSENGKGYFYRSDWAENASPFLVGNNKWTPSIFCTRKASRITLEVTAVRVERLNDISEADACAEGYYFAQNRCPDEYDAFGWYETLWESINGAGSWKANPWVWVVEFKRIIT